MTEDRPLDTHIESFATLALSGDIAAGLRADPAYAQHGKNARSLVRSPELTLVVTALRAGYELKPHHAPATATAVVLEGEIVFTVHSESSDERVLAAHECAVFTPQVRHSVRARKDSLLLIVMGARASSAP